MRWREVRNPAGMRGEPRLRELRAMARAVVQHDMNLQCRLDAAVDLVEERTEVLRVVLPRDRLREDLTVVNVQRSEQRRCAMTDVLPLDSLAAPWGGGLVLVFAFLGLHRGLLVDRQHDRVVGAVQIDATHVADPIPEVGVITTVQPAAHLGDIDVHRLEDPADLRWGNLDPVGEQRVGKFDVSPHGHGIIVFLFRCRDRGEFHAVVMADPSGASAASPVLQSVEPIDHEPFAPHADLVLIHCDLDTDLGQRHPLLAQQDRSCSAHLASCRRVCTHSPLKLVAILVSQHQPLDREPHESLPRRIRNPSNHTRATSAVMH